MNSKFKGQAEHFSVVQSQSVVYDTDTGNYDVCQIYLYAYCGGTYALKQQTLCTWSFYPTYYFLFGVGVCV